MKCLLKFDITQPVDHDFGLSPEEFGSSAVHPPVRVLVLETDQGYPRNINVHASDEGSDIGITVEDVLRAISTDLRETSIQREWAALNEERRREVEETFEDRARTEEDRSGGLRKIDYLRGRTRLRIFPRHSLPEDEEILQLLSSARAVWVILLSRSLLLTHTMSFHWGSSSVPGPSSLMTVRPADGRKTRAA